MLSLYAVNSIKYMWPALNLFWDCGGCKQSQFQCSASGEPFCLCHLCAVLTLDLFAPQKNTKRGCLTQLRANTILTQYQRARYVQGLCEGEENT